VAECCSSILVLLPFVCAIHASTVSSECCVDLPLLGSDDASVAQAFSSVTWDCGVLIGIYCVRRWSLLRFTVGLSTAGTYSHPSSSVLLGIDVSVCTPSSSSSRLLCVRYSDSVSCVVDCGVERWICVDVHRSTETDTRCDRFTSAVGTRIRLPSTIGIRRDTDLAPYPWLRDRE